MIKDIKRNRGKVVKSDYVHAPSGELLSSQLLSDKDCANQTLTITEDTNHFEVHSKEYLIIDSEAMRNLKEVLSKKDVQKLAIMGDTLKTDFNVLFNNNIPHSVETLADYLGISANELYRLVKRLYQKNVLCYVKCTPLGYEQKVYLMNPTIMRKRKSFHKALKTFFKDYTDDKNFPENPKTTPQV